jgi:transcriptional regulator with XRE-family HTH domain
MAKGKFEIFGVGIKIELARTENKWNQEELAKRVKVIRQTIGRWENGETMPDEEDLQKIALATGKPLSFFLPTGVTPEQASVLNDPIAFNIASMAHKKSQDVKNTVKDMLDCLPNLTPERRQAILTLCKQ